MNGERHSFPTCEHRGGPRSGQARPPLPSTDSIVRVARLRPSNARIGARPDRADSPPRSTQNLAEHVDGALVVLDDDAHVVGGRVVAFLRQQAAGPFRYAAETARRGQPEIGQVFPYRVELGAHPVDAVQMVNGADIDSSTADIQVPEGAEPGVVGLGDRREMHD